MGLDVWPQGYVVLSPGLQEGDNEDEGESDVSVPWRLGLGWGQGMHWPCVPNLGEVPPPNSAIKINVNAISA